NRLKVGNNAGGRIDRRRKTDLGKVQADQLLCCRIEQARRNDNELTSRSSDRVIRGFLWRQYSSLGNTRFARVVQQREVPAPHARMGEEAGLHVDGRNSPIPLIGCEEPGSLQTRNRPSDRGADIVDVE